uniref:Uncharacterized protein n=1 Tax=Tetranychus urticae TaxID=32264 RepID=T1KP95_TETUR
MEAKMNKQTTNKQVNGWKCKVDKDSIWTILPTRKKESIMDITWHNQSIHLCQRFNHWNLDSIENRLPSDGYKAMTNFYTTTSDVHLIQCFKC